MDEQALTEQDIRSKYISPAILAAGWDSSRQVREEVQLAWRASMPRSRKIMFLMSLLSKEADLMSLISIPSDPG